MSIHGEPVNKRNTEALWIAGFTFEFGLRGTASDV